MKLRRTLVAYRLDISGTIPDRVDERGSRQRTEPTTIPTRPLLCPPGTTATSLW
jgi:hypothetical protein